MTTLKKVKKHLKRIQPYLCDCMSGDCPDKFIYKDVPWLVNQIEKLTEEKQANLNKVTRKYGDITRYPLDVQYALHLLEPYRKIDLSEYELPHSLSDKNEFVFPPVEGAVGYEAHANTGIVGYMEKPPDPLLEMTKKATYGIKWPW